MYYISDISVDVFTLNTNSLFVFDPLNLSFLFKHLEVIDLVRTSIHAHTNAHTNTHTLQAFADDDVVLEDPSKGIELMGNEVGMLAEVKINK